MLVFGPSRYTPIRLCMHWMLAGTHSLHSTTRLNARTTRPVMPDTEGCLRRHATTILIAFLESSGRVMSNDVKKCTARISLYVRVRSRGSHDSFQTMSESVIHMKLKLYKCMYRHKDGRASAPPAPMTDATPEMVNHRSSPYLYTWFRLGRLYYHYRSD